MMMLQAIPFYWEINQLIKAGIFSSREEVIGAAMRLMFRTYPDIKQKMAIHAYINGDISLGKAARIMGVSQEEMKDILAESGKEIHLGPCTETELSEDIKNA